VKTCEKCGAVTHEDGDPYEGPGRPVYMPGEAHHRTCPIFGDLFDLNAPHAVELRAKLKEMDDCRRRAWAGTANYVIG
jgi:hypothetical protein